MNTLHSQQCNCNFGKNSNINCNVEYNCHNHNESHINNDNIIYNHRNVDHSLNDNLNYNYIIEHDINNRSGNNTYVAPNINTNINSINGNVDNNINCYTHNTANIPSQSMFKSQLEMKMGICATQSVTNSIYTTDKTSLNNYLQFQQIQAFVQRMTKIEKEQEKEKNEKQEKWYNSQFYQSLLAKKGVYSYVGIRNIKLYYKIFCIFLICCNVAYLLSLCVFFL